MQPSRDVRCDGGIGGVVVDATVTTGIYLNIEQRPIRNASAARFATLTVCACSTFKAGIYTKTPLR